MSDDSKTTAVTPVVIGTSDSASVATKCPGCLLCPRPVECSERRSGDDYLIIKASDYKYLAVKQKALNVETLDIMKNAGLFSMGLLVAGSLVQVYANKSAYDSGFKAGEKSVLDAFSLLVSYNPQPK